MTDLYVELVEPVELGGNSAKNSADPAARRPVFLIHGFASRSELNWKQSGWVTFLTRAGRPVILVDLPGHGHSSGLVPAPGSTHNPYLPSNIVRALALAAKTAGVNATDPMDLMGYSLGARLAWELMLEQPELVHRAVLGGATVQDHLAMLNVHALRDQLADASRTPDRNTPAVVDSPPAGALSPTGSKSAQSTLPITEQHTIESELAAMLASPFNAGANRERMLALAQAAAEEPFTPLDRQATLPTPEHTPPGQTGAAPLPHAPTLFLSGAQDTLSDPASLAALAPQFSYALIEGRDHVSVLTSREFKEQALEFLNQD